MKPILTSVSALLLSSYLFLSTQAYAETPSPTEQTVTNASTAKTSLQAIIPYDETYEASDDHPEKLLESVKKLTQEALEGNKRSMYELLFLYDRHSGLPGRQNNYYWMEQLALSGDSIMEVQMGVTYWVGSFSDTIKKDPERSRAWFEQAVQNPKPVLLNIPLFHLGRMSMIGAGGPVDYALAKSYFEKGRELKDHNATLELANIYRQGLGVPVDYAKALELYREVAEVGYYKAYAALSEMYMNGEGVPKNEQEAAIYKNKEAEALEKTIPGLSVNSPFPYIQ